MAWLKERTQVSNTWLAEQFGSQPKYVGKLAASARREPEPIHELVRLRRQKGER